MSLKVAIVGSGPAGFYTADAFLKTSVECEIDIFERLPCPYGLIRFGVAPDHEKTRNVWRAFAKTAEKEPVKYFGNIEVGRDILINELLESYDAVVAAVGAGKDQPLKIPGADKSGVFGSATFVNWYNSHPDKVDLKPNLNTNSVVVIGAGNVAIDVARVLLKTKQEMSNTDLATHAAATIHPAPIQNVYLVARRSAAEAKFTNVELREMGALDDADVCVDTDTLPKEVIGEMSDRDRRVREKNISTLREFGENGLKGKAKKLHFIFCAQPISILGSNEVDSIQFERTKIVNGRTEMTGDTFNIKCGAVIAATGYRSEPLPGVPFDEIRGIIPNESGRVSEGLYVSGWVKRGPSGVIGTNKVDAQDTVKLIMEDVSVGSNKPGRKAVELLLSKRGCKIVGFEDWKIIQAAEEAAATGDSPRQKFARVGDMMQTLENNS